MCPQIGGDEEKQKHAPRLDCVTRFSEIHTLHPRTFRLQFAGSLLAGHWVRPTQNLPLPTELSTTAYLPCHCLGGTGRTYHILVPPGPVLTCLPHLATPVKVLGKSMVTWHMVQWPVTMLANNLPLCSVTAFTKKDSATDLVPALLSGSCKPALEGPPEAGAGRSHTYFPGD